MIIAHAAVVKNSSTVTAVFNQNLTKSGIMEEMEGGAGCLKTAAQPTTLSSINTNLH